MARRDDIKVVKKVKNTPQRVLVVQNRHPLFGEPIPYKVIYKETVPNIAEAKKREAELREEYKDIEAVSVQHFSL